MIISFLQAEDIAAERNLMSLVDMSLSEEWTAKEIITMSD